MRIFLMFFEVFGNVVEGFVVNGNFRIDDKNGEERLWIYWIIFR